MFETIIPENEQHWLDLRTKVLTSTDMAALFGISPYCTPYELWWRKKDNVVIDFKGNERTEWGLFLQDGIAAKFAKDNGWNIRRMNEFIMDKDIRVGSSFDFSIDEDGILEVKNVGFQSIQKDWLFDGDNIEAPAFIELQVQVQLFVSNRKYAYIGALQDGNKGILIRREPSPKIHDAIKQKCAAFWESIDKDQSPAPNFETDSKFIATLYNSSEPGKVVSVAEDEGIVAMVEEYKALGNAIKTAETGREEIKAKVLMAIGDAEKAFGGAFTISAGMVGPADIAYRREGYRMFKINFKKG